MNRQLHYLCAAFLGAGMLHITPPLCAQTDEVVVPYVPEKTDFGGSAVSDLSSFVPSTGNYTLAVEGTANQEITVNGGKYSYTPETSGTVRFVSYNGTVYVYEGNEYKGTLSQELPEISFPEINDDNILTEGSQLLQNQAFQTPGSLVGGSNYNFGEPWVTNITVSSSGGVRVTPLESAVGGYKLLWRGANNDNYFAQSLDNKIKPDTYYKVYVKQLEAANANSEFYFGLGSTENGLEYAYDAIRLGTNQGDNTIKDITIKTPSEIASTVYFTVKNTHGTCSSGNDPLTHIDYIGLVEGTLTSTGITGITSATYLAGEAYAPEISSAVYDMTAYIQNPGFEENQGDRQQTFPGWNKTGNSNSEYCTRNNADGRLTHGDGNIYFQYWTPSTNTLPDFSVTQEITSLPNGKYRVTAAGSFGGNGFFLVANEQQTAISTDNDYSVETTVLDGTLTLGVVMKEATSNFAKADHFRLYYLGYDATAAIAQLKETVDATAELAQSNMNAEIKKQLTEAVSAAQAIIDAGTGTDEQITAAGSALNEAITAATASAESYAALKTALDEANAKAENITTTEEAKKSFTDKIAEITGKYNDGSIADADIESTIAEVNSAYLALLTSQETPVDLTSLLVNPGFEEGDGWNNGWTIDRNTTGGADFALMEGQNPTEGAKIFNAWAQQINYIHVTQNITLPAGTYKLTGDVRSDRENTTAEGTRLVALVGEKTFESDLMQFINPTGNWKDKENWNNLSVTFFLQEEQEVTVGIYSKGQNRNGNTEGFFQADNMQLAYLGKEAIIEGESDLTVIGVTSANELNEYLTPEVTSVDIRDAVITEGTLSPKNPNTVIYGLEGEEKVLELQEGYKFNAPEAIAANVTYTRLAFATDEGTKVNHKTLRGWQTICLPFDVTEITAAKDGFAVPLKPIMSADFDNGVDDSNNNYAHPFWLYAIVDGELAPATEIKANVPYLMLVPNDPDFYAPFYNIPGDITFKGYSIAATDLQVQDGSDYDLRGYFGGTAENLPVQEGTTYYGLDAEGSAFVQTGFAPIASFQAFATLPTTPQAAPQTLSIFDDGDGQLTALPNIREALGDRASGIQVYTADGGIRIESAKAGSVTVYTVDGQALQTVALTAGGSEFVALPAGKYIVNGTVVIAQ